LTHLELPPTTDLVEAGGDVVVVEGDAAEDEDVVDSEDGDVVVACEVARVRDQTGSGWTTTLTLKPLASTRISNRLHRSRLPLRRKHQ